MQPEMDAAEDLHSILSRFHAWSGKGAGTRNGNGHKPGEGVREIPYEEALRRVRSRNGSRRPRLAAQGPAKQAETQKSGMKPETGGSGALPCPAAAAEQAPAAPAKGKAAVGAAARPAEAAATAKAAQRPAPRRVAGAKGAAKAAKAAAESGRAAKKRRPRAKGRRRRRKSEVAAAVAAKKAGAGRSTEFREVLARSVGKKTAKGKAQKAREPERVQRVSVRLSQAEERHLQGCARRAGLTVSAFVRERALGAIAAGSQAKNEAGTPGARTGRDALSAAPQPAKNNSVLGEWIALLRHRFLASPVRFAERA